MRAVSRTEQADAGTVLDITNDHPTPIDRSAGHASYTHELPEETADAMTRGIVRIVPLVFSAVLGSLAGSAAIGLLAAATTFVAFDLAMEEHSILRALLRRLRRA